MTEFVPIDRRIWRRVSRLIESEGGDDPRYRKRLEKIARGYLSGKTCAAVSEEVGITAERVRQILRGLGITRLQGGVSLRTLRRRSAQEAARRRKREQVAQRYYRCTHAEVEKVIAEWHALSPAYRHLPHWRHSSPLHRFRAFYLSLRKRLGRTPEITLPDWWAVWRDSGHWKAYGRGRNKYHMEFRDISRPFDARNLVVKPSGSVTDAVASASRKPSGRATGRKSPKVSSAARAGRTTRTAPRS